MPYAFGFQNLALSHKNHANIVYHEKLVSSNIDVSESNSRTCPTTSWECTRRIKQDMIILRKVSSEAEQPLFTEAFCAEVGIVDATIIQDVQENNFRSLAIIVARKKWKD